MGTASMGVELLQNEGRGLDLDSSLGEDEY